MDDPSPETWGWLLGFGLCALVALLGIAGQAALQHASRPRLRLLADGRVRGARSALAMLADGSPVPTLLLVLVIVGMGGAAASLVTALLPRANAESWQAVLIA